MLVASNFKAAKPPKLNAWLSALGLTALFISLRWNNYDVPLVRDEGEYAYAAQLLKHGLPPYQHAFLQKPPMVVYTYALADALAPHVFWFSRLLAALFVALATGLIGIIARLEFGPGTSFPAMWLFTPMVLLPEVQQFTANTEMFLLLPLMATIAVYAVARRHGCGLLPWLLAGFLAAVAVWYKYTAAGVLGTLFALWSLEEWRTGASLRGLLRRWGFGLLGACLASAAVLAFFIVKGGTRQLWECTVLFNRHYTTSDTFGFSSLWFVMKLLWADWWLLFLLPCVLVVSPVRRVWFWATLFLAAWVSAGASIYGQYYVLVTPFWTLLTLMALNKLAAWAAAKLAWPQLWLQRGLTAAVVAVICLPHLPWVTRTREQFAARKLMADNPFIESVAAAKRVAELTSPRDYVFVAGSEPQILYYARRFSPTRFVITYPLMIPTSLAQGYQREAIQALQQHPPALIVLARSNYSWLAQDGSPTDFQTYVNQLLASSYERVSGYVLNAESGRWEEPLPEEHLPNSTLVLFKRKGLRY